MIDILGMDREELTAYLAGLGEKNFRARQIYEWLHVKRAERFSQMTDLPARLREQLDRDCVIAQPSVLRTQISAKDGTRKYLLGWQDGARVESVLMEYEHGLSVCISSQVGCRMGCVFCASTVPGWTRNLSCGELLGEVYRMETEAGRRIGNIVVMGMGEPLDNYDAVVKWIRILTDAQGHRLSGRAITISTCGLCDRIRMLAEENFGITLAVSLHAPNQQKRMEIMPVAARYGLEELMQTCRDYFEKTGRRVTFEYALIAGVNDSAQDVRELASLLRGMHAHVNLIPVNPAREHIQKPDKKAVYRFRDALQQSGINATVRRTLGSDIDGACGQLGLRYQEEEI